MKQYLAGFTVLFAVILILAVDQFIVLKWGYDYSVSDFMQWIEEAFPVVCVLAGIAVGHFWGGNLKGIFCLVIGIVLGHFIWPVSSNIPVIGSKK